MTANKKEKKFTKKAFLRSPKYSEFYVLKELLEDDVLYSIAEVEAMLKQFRKDVE